MTMFTYHIELKDLLLEATFFPGGILLLGFSIKKSCRYLVLFNLKTHVIDIKILATFFLQCCI